MFTRGAEHVALASGKYQRGDMAASTRVVKVP